MDDEKKPEPSEHVVEVLGIDQNATFNQYIGALQQHLDKNEAKTRAEHAEAAARAQYELKETIWMRVVRKVDPLRGLTAYWGEAVAGLPAGCSINLHMDSLSDLLHETRFSFATTLHKSGIERDWDKAKERAARCTVELADLVEG